MPRLTNGKSILLAAALGGVLLFAGAPAARPQYREDQCEQRIRKAEANLHQEIARHGERSPQAERRRHELEQVRERCRRDRDFWCERRIREAEANLHREIARHGERSPQAERRRHELEQVRESCHRDHDRDHDRDRH